MNLKQIVTALVLILPTTLLSVYGKPAIADRPDCPQFVDGTSLPADSRTFKWEAKRITFDIPSSYRVETDGSGKNALVSSPAAYKENSCLERNKVGTDDTAPVIFVSVEKAPNDLDVWVNERTKFVPEEMRKVSLVTIGFGTKGMVYFTTGLFAELNTSFLSPDGQKVITISARMKPDPSDWQSSGSPDDRVYDFNVYKQIIKSFSFK